MDIRPSDEQFLSTGTTIHAAESGTAVDIHNDLQKLKGEVVGMENELIRCMESGEARRLQDVAELDAKLEEARKRLADLQETQNFVVSKQRERAHQDNRDLSYLIYLVKWAGGTGGASTEATDNTAARDDDTTTDASKKGGDDLLHSDEKPAPPPGFNGSQIAEYVRDLTTLHQTTGATGVLYILRGWFAGYTEADAETVFKMARNLKLAKESTDRFDRVVIVERERILPAKRRYPNDALKVVHLETQQSVAQTAPEASILREISHLMNLDVFVPDLSVANRGSGARTGDAVYQEALELNRALVASVIKGSASLIPTASSSTAGVEGALLATSPASLTNSNRGVVTQVRGELAALGVGAETSYVQQPTFPTSQRLLVSIAPQLTFYESGLPNKEISRIIQKVTTMANKHLVQFTNSQYRCGTGGPHTMDTGLLLVIDTANVAHAVGLIVDLYKDVLVKDGEIKAFYKPIIAIHSSPQVGMIMNGLCTVVGPGMRYIRRLVGLCRQEGFPMLLSYTAADRAERQRCTTVGNFLIDRDPSELFIPTDLEKVRYAPEAELFKQLHATAAQQFDAHIEGPGPIEPQPLTHYATAQDKHHHSQRQELAIKRAPPADDVSEETYFSIKGMTSVTEIQEMYAELLERAEREYRSVLDARRAAEGIVVGEEDGEEGNEVDETLGGVPWDLFEAFYHSFDTLGVPASSATDIRNLIEATTDGMAIHPKRKLALQQEQKQRRAQQGGDLVSFEQFCAAMYHILKR